MPGHATIYNCSIRLGLAPATVQKYARDGRIPFDLTPGGIGVSTSRRYVPRYRRPMPRSRRWRRQPKTGGLGQPLWS